MTHHERNVSTRIMANTVIRLATVAALSLTCSSYATAADQTPLPYGVTSFGGLNWGIGVSADFDVGGTRATGAQLVNNIVQVTNTSGNVDVGFVLEAHYFITDDILSSTAKNVVCAPPYPFCKFEVGSGPFVAIEVNGGTSASPTSGPITGYGLGWMIGLHRLLLDPSKKDDNSSWNLGVGLRVTPAATVLADGVVANQPPPSGFGNGDLLKTEPRLGVMVVSSFSF